MEVEARPATPDDLHPLVALGREHRLELSVLRGGALLIERHARQEPLESAFRSALDEDATGVWVGAIDGTAVGYALASSDRGTAVLEELHVDPQARHVGVGEALLDQVVAWAQGCGCRGIDAHALPGTRDTKNFFETFGLTARLLVVHRDL